MVGQGVSQGREPPLGAHRRGREAPGSALGPWLSRPCRACSGMLAGPWGGASETAGAGALSCGAAPTGQVPEAAEPSRPGALICLPARVRKPGQCPRAPLAQGPVPGHPFLTAAGSLGPGSGCAVSSPWKARPRAAWRLGRKPGPKPQACRCRALSAGQARKTEARAWPQPSPRGFMLKSSSSKF